MTVETMRRAAAQIREDYDETWIDQQSRDFYTAVADWLDAESFRRDANAHVDCTDVEHCPHASALAVARAYLGGQQ